MHAVEVNNADTRFCSVGTFITPYSQSLLQMGKCYHTDVFFGGS